MKNFNIEIKAHCNTHTQIQAILSGKNAFFKGLDHQVDTYFKVTSGRLKIRQGNVESALIQYNRSNQKEAKKSDYQLFKSENLEDLKKILSNSIGISVIVDKMREIYFINNAKIHLDDVKGLGKFVEIEIVNMGDQNDPEFNSLEEQCQYYIELFGIREEDLIEHSYSDMV